MMTVSLQAVLSSVLEIDERVVSVCSFAVLEFASVDLLLLRDLSVLDREVLFSSLSASSSPPLIPSSSSMIL